MTHAYAQEIHGFIAKGITASERARQKAELAGNRHEKAYQEGKLKELLALRKLLNESYDLSTQKYF